ncbi:MAG: hypothetical protein IKO32_09220 [Lachnospiraceae bacterium]|nr:hypothetical protein [Lachnospiraceae bacterium]
MGKKSSGNSSVSFIEFLRDEEFWYILLTLYFFVRNVSYVYSKQGVLLNSDASGEMILASHLNKVGGFLSTDWFYSSELRVLNTQIVYKLGLLFFPHNWHLARTFSVGLFMLILIAAGWYLMWVMGKKKKGFLAAAILICPFGQWYAWNVIYNSYYVPHIAISLLSVAMFIHLMKTDKKPLRYMLIALSVILALVAGLGGVRQLMVCYIPLWIAMLILVIPEIGKKAAAVSENETGTAKQNGDDSGNVVSGKKSLTFMFLLSTGILAGSFVGYLINEKVLSNIFSFKDYTETIWMEFNFENVRIVSEQLFRQFGWVPYIKVFSFEGVMNFISFVMILVIIAAFIISWKKFKSLPKEEQILLTYTTIASVLMLFLFAETWVYNESYWIPILPFMFFPLIFLIKIEEKDNKGLIFAGAFMLTLVCLGISTGKHPFILDVPNSEDIHKVAYWLSEQDEYTKGIASFWSAPVVTELTDGKIEMWTVEDYEHLEPSTWLQEKSHINLPEGKVFILMPCSQADADPYRKQELKNRVLYNDGKYIVYGFDNYMQYFAGAAEE